MAHHDQDVYADQDAGWPCPICYGAACEACCHTGEFFGSLRGSHRLTHDEAAISTVEYMPPRREIASEWVNANGVRVQELREDGDE